jgi:mannose-6-phosphate isomerase-like protein (cupin superfamily)
MLVRNLFVAAIVMLAIAFFARPKNIVVATQKTTTATTTPVAPKEPIVPYWPEAYYGQLAAWRGIHVHHHRHEIWL